MVLADGVESFPMWDLVYACDSDEVYFNEYSGIRPIDPADINGHRRCPTIVADRQVRGDHLLGSDATPLRKSLVRAVKGPSTP